MATTALTEDPLKFPVCCGDDNAGEDVPERQACVPMPLHYVVVSEL